MFPFPHLTSSSNRQWTPPVFTVRSTRLRISAAAERHSSSVRRVQWLSGYSHRQMRFDAGPSFHSLNRYPRVEYLHYALGSAYDTTFVFGRTHRLQTADMNSCPPLRLIRFRHNRAGNGTGLARYRLHCISRNCPFNESTVRSKSTSRSTPTNLPAVSIMPSLLSLIGC